MSISDVVEAANKANISIINPGIIEANIAEQPYTNVYFSFVDNIDDFNSKVSTGSKEDIIQFAFKEASMEYAYTLMSYGFAKPITIEEEEKNKILIQANAQFTSDAKYSTAVDTFDTVEEYLKKQYGETRYTSKRGESLPEVYGYRNVPSVVYMGTGKKGSVPYYSHREIKLENGQYLIIDHHICIFEGKQQFAHRLVFSLIPMEI